MKKIKLLSLSVFVFMLFTAYSGAVVLVQDTSEDAGLGPDTTSGPIPVAGTGQAGDFVLLACSTRSDGGNQFLDPTPDDWTSFIQEDCTGNRCILGVWGRFVDTNDSENVSCNWSEIQSVFVGGSIGYSGVNTQEPIIDNIACSKGSGNVATAPSILAFSKSQVVRIAAGTEIEENDVGEVAPQTLFMDGAESATIAATASFGLATTTSIQGESELLFTSGPTGDFDIELNTDIDTWVACTLAIQMEATPIPTMSEWGFIAVAAFMGIAGVWFLRRKQAQSA